MEKLTIKNGDFESVGALFEVENAVGVVLLVHGSLEHKERYYPFIKHLNKCGLTALIFDIRGHGESVDENYPRGYMKNSYEIVSDLEAWLNLLETKYPKLPKYLFGHSLGTVFCRLLLQKSADKFEKVAISGTVPPQKLAVVGKALSKLFPAHGHSQFLNSLAAIKKDDSWISTSKTNLDAYRADPLNTKRWQNSGAKVVFESVQKMGKLKLYTSKNDSLQVALFSGALDPITKGEKGLSKSILLLNKLGFKHVTSHIFENMKHEILNEDDNLQVFEQISNFFS